MEVSELVGSFGLSCSMRHYLNPRGVSDVEGHRDELTKPCRLSSLFKTLKIDKLIVAASFSHQLNVVSGLSDLSIFENVDDVCIPDGAQSVGHGDGSATLGSGI